jgi:hypothetical protein
MFLFKLVLALAIIIGALVLVFRFHRQIQAGNGGSKTPAGKKEDAARATELEEFIAAYRRDKGTGQVQPNPTAPAQLTAVPAVTAATDAAAPVKVRATFLAGPAKLGFLVLKAGLPDHHVFANTRVSDLMDGPTVPALGNLAIDLLVCSKDLSIVAAVDLDSGKPADTLLEREKEQRLRAAGICYLRFTPGAFPKPAEVRGLVYGDG